MVSAPGPGEAAAGGGEACAAGATMGPPEGAARATDAMPGRRTASRVGPIGRGGTLRRGEGRRDRGSVRRPRGRLRGGGARRGRGCGSEGVRSRLGGREGGRRRRDRLVARPDAFRVFPRRAGPTRGALPRGAVDRRAIAVASARARANSPARRPLRSSRRRGRTRSRRVGSAAAFPRAGARPGKAVGRPGASARPTAEPQKAKKACGTTPGNRRARAARRLAHLRSASQPRVRVCASIASMGGLVCGARRRFWRARPTAPPSVRKPSHTRNVATCASRTSASWRTQKRTNKQSPKLEFLRLFFF